MDQQKAYYDVALLKQRVLHNQLPQPFQTIQLPVPPGLKTIRNENHRQRLTDRYDKLLQRTKSETIMVHLEIAEIKLQEIQETFDAQMNRIKHGQGSLPVHVRFTPKMIDVVKRRFQLYEKRLSHSYESKLHFFVSAPTVTN